MNKARVNYLTLGNGYYLSPKWAVTGIISIVALIGGWLWVASLGSLSMAILALVLTVIVGMLINILAVQDIKGLYKNVKELFKIEKVIRLKGEVSEEDFEEIVTCGSRIKKKEYIKVIHNEYKKDIGLSIDRSKEMLEKGELETAKEIMKSTREDIDDIWDQQDKSEDIKKVLETKGRLSIIEGFEDSLLKEPKRIIEAPDYIYIMIPNLLLLLEKYTKVEKIILKDERDIKVMDETLEVVGYLCDEISKDYDKFKGKKIKDLSVRVNAVLKEGEHVN